MTLTEKILARAAGKARVQAGDKHLGQGGRPDDPRCVRAGNHRSVPTRRSARRQGLGPAERSSLFRTDYIFTARLEVPTATWTFSVDFAHEQGLPYFYDVIDDRMALGNTMWQRGIETPVRVQLRRRCHHRAALPGAHNAARREVAGSGGH